MTDDDREARRADGPTVGDDGRGLAGVPDDAGREFDWRGWVLIGWLFLAIVVVPAYLYVYPRASESLAVFGLGYRGTFLVLPLVPAILLGLLAVWATTRP
jgi:hypothetical protein